MFRLICTHHKCKEKKTKSFGISTFMEHLAFHTSEDFNSNDLFAFRCSLAACDARFVTKLHAEEHAHETHHTVLSMVTHITGRSVGGVEFAKVLKTNGVVQNADGSVLNPEGGGQNHVHRQTRHGPVSDEIEQQRQQYGLYSWKSPPRPERPPDIRPGVPRGIIKEEASSRVFRQQQTQGRIGQEENRNFVDRSYVCNNVDVQSPTFEYPEPEEPPKSYEVETFSNREIPPPPRLRTKSESVFTDDVPPKRPRHSSDSQGASGTATPIVLGKLTLAGENFMPVPPPDESLLRMMSKKKEALIPKIIPPPPFASNKDVRRESRSKSATKKPPKAKESKPAYQFDPDDPTMKRGTVAQPIDDDIFILDDLPLGPLPTYEEMFEQDGRESEDEIILLDDDKEEIKVKSEFPIPPEAPRRRAVSPYPTIPHRRNSVSQIDAQRSRRGSRSPADRHSRSRSRSRQGDRPRRERRDSDNAQAARKKALEDWDAETTHVSNEDRSTFSRYGGQRPPRNLVKIGILPDVPRRTPTPPRGSWEAKLKSQERNKENVKKRYREMKNRRNIGHVTESEDDEVTHLKHRKRNSSTRRPRTRSRSRTIERVNYEESPIKKEISSTSSAKKTGSRRSYSHSPRSASP